MVLGGPVKLSLSFYMYYSGIPYEMGLKERPLRGGRQLDVFKLKTPVLYAKGKYSKYREVNQIYCQLLIDYFQLKTF